MGRAPADPECRHVVDMSMMAVTCVAEDTDSQDSGDKYVTLILDTETADTYSNEFLSSRSSTNVALGNK